MKKTKQILILFLLWVGGIYISECQIVINGDVTICSGNSTTLSVGTASPSSDNCNSSVNMCNGSTIVTCGETICFYDSGGPNSSYGNSESYVHTFTSSNSGHVTITFLTANGETCCDYITVYDGTSTSSTQLHYGLLSTVNGNVSFTSSGSSLTVQFTSDGSVTYDGWSAIVYCGESAGGSTTSCSSSVNMRNGSTTVTCGESICFYDSGGPNSSYGNSESYVHTFRSSGSEHITITFLSANGETCCDYISIYDGTSTSSTELHYGLLSTVNGNVSFTSSGTSLTVEFTSDGSVTYDGWSAIVSCGNGGGGGGGNCSTSVNMRNGSTIVNCGESVCFYDSGGPSGSYGNSESYVHTFTSSTNTPLTINFTSATGETCCDYIYVYDGNSVNATQLHYGLLSTVNGNVSYTSTGGSLTVKFTSDGSVTYDGWSATVYCDPSYNYNYSWSTGATTPTITVTPNGTTTYSVTVSGDGIETQTASITINVVDCGSSGCPSISPAELGTGNTNIIVDCDVTEITLAANAVATAATANDYTVTSIPYAPPYSFTDGTRIFADATDDTWGSVVNLPFAFCYYGNTYTQIVPGANSVATFNTDVAEGSCAWSFSSSLPSSSLFENTIFACYRDIYPSSSDYVASTGSGAIYEGVLGAYPCRSYKLSFNNIKLFSCTEVTTFSSMIVLYEGTNIIDIYLRDAPTCTDWNSGNGVIGIQNGDGTAAVVPPGRNTGSWTAHNEAWRFVPTGTPVYTVTWYQGSDITGPVVGTGDVITITPTGTTDYTARLQYTACNGNTFDIVNTCHVTVNNSAPPVTVTASPDYLCANSPTTLTVSAPGATSYAWSTGATTATTTAYPTTEPTTYTVTVGYANGCHSLGSVTVHLDQTPPVYSGNVGPIAANVSGCVSTVPDLTGMVRPYCTDDLTATANLTITQSPTAGSTISGPTTVTLTITDACGNSSTATVQVTVPDLPQLQLVQQHDILCYGASTGYLSVAGSSGTPPYTFRWTTGSASNPANGSNGTTISSLQADTYTVTLTDAEGCTVTGTYTLQYLNQPMVAGTLSEEQVICSGGAPQPLSVSGSSGGADSYYVWQQSTDGTTFTNIAGAGNGSTYAPGNLPQRTCYRVAYTSDSCGVVYTNTICITLGEPARTEIEDIVCYGVPYAGNGFNIPAASLTTPGIHTDSLTLQTAEGCDSIVVLHLTVLPPVTSTDEQTIVENQLPYTWNSVVFTAEGTQTAVLTGSDGCDSTVTMTLHVNPNVSVSIDTTVCDNALPLQWQGVTFTAEGTQSVVYPSSTGSDSTVYLTVHVIPPVFVTVRDGVCQNEPYSGYGFTVTAEETAVEGVVERSQLYFTPLGCDSTVTLLLTVYPNYNHHFDVVACDSMIWNGQIYRQSGTYTQQFTSAHGCDSTVTKDVEVVNTDLALINHTPDFCEDFEAELEVVTQLEHIRWSTGEENVNHIVAHHAGAYVVTANTAHCEAFDRIVIPACAFNLYIPNAITPSNGDGTNDYFFLPDGMLSQVETFEIRIFDRWGRMVFQSENPRFRWDGREKGKLRAPNTYSYYIKLSVYGGGDYLYKGVITVL